MPKFIKINYIDNLMERDETKKTMFDYYWPQFTNKNKNNLENYSFLAKFLLKNENQFQIIEKKSNVESVVYNNLFKIDMSPNNYLFTKFYHFHSGFLEFNEIIKDRNNFEISEETIKDFIFKQFYVCLEKNKRQLGSSLHELSDMELISNICIRERLTLFNYLTKEVSRDTARDYINKEYMKILKGKNIKPKLENSKKFSDFFEFYEKN